MVKPAASVPVACRFTVVHPAGGEPLVCSLIALTICGAVSAGGSVEDVAGDDGLPFGGPVVSCRSSTMVAGPAPAPRPASTPRASHTLARRVRGRAGAAADGAA